MILPNLLLNSNDIKEDYLLIKKSDIEKLGKKALKEVYDYLDPDNIDTKNTNQELLSEMKKSKKDLDKLIIKKLMNPIKKSNKVKYFFKGEDENEDEDKNIKAYYRTQIKKEIENESFDIDTIYNFLDKINFTWDMGEDPFCSRRTFLSSYELFFSTYYELEY